MKAIADRRHHRQAPVLLLLLALLVTGALYAVFSPSAASADAPSESDIQAGSNLFKANCATCHGMGAEGRGEVPSLIGVGAAAVDFQVSTGRMPMQAAGPQALAKPPQFDEEQIAQLAAYVASLAPGPAIPSDEQVDPAGGDPATGMSLFRTNCAMCHGAIGKGGALTDGKFAPSLSGTTPRQVYEAMVTGPSNMPMFADSNLTPDEKRDIIAFLDEQQQGSAGGADLGGVGPVTEGLWAWVVGMGLLIGCAVWIGAKAS